MDIIKHTYDKAMEIQDLNACIKIASNYPDLKADINELAQKVIESKNPLYVISFVRTFKPKDIKDFERIVLQSADAHIAMIFAVENKNLCNLKPFEQLILVNGDAHDCADYICAIESDRQEEFKNKILREEQAYPCLLYCEKYQPYGRDLKPFQEIVIDSEEVDTAYLFAKNIYDADIVRLSGNVIKYGSIGEIIQYAILVNERYEELYKSVVESECKNGYNEAKNWEVLDNYRDLINNLEDVVVRSQDLDSIRDFLFAVPLCNVFRLQKIIEASDRKDLKLDIAKLPKVGLNSLNESILRNKKLFNFDRTM